MLVLHETAAGYAIFKLTDEKKLQKVDLSREFQTPDRASKLIKLKHFEHFASTAEALAAATASVEGKLTKKLKTVLKKYVLESAQEPLLVADAKLGGAIKEKLKLNTVSSNLANEVARCIRSQLENLVGSISEKDSNAMSLGLAHSLSRYKLKFSPDKLDTMIVQALSLLEELDKELNNYLMRCREWYGWHFPELGKVVTDTSQYVKTIKAIGTREKAVDCDLSEILPDDLEKEVKDLAKVSMGTEIAQNDVDNILGLCDQVEKICSYRSQLFDYLKSRMMAVAPNLTVLLGELIGAKLLAQAGSILNLAKHPASTVQILGAEKALFRAIKARKDTPKYGIIYNAQLVGQASNMNKGKISRMLAAKVSLATRVDALGDDPGMSLGIEHKALLEGKLRMLEEGSLRGISGTAKARAKFEKYYVKSEINQYPVSADSTIPNRKRKHSEMTEDVKPLILKEIKTEETDSPMKKKSKKTVHKEEPKSTKEVTEQVQTAEPSKKKKKKRAADVMVELSLKEVDEAVTETAEPSKKKKKKKTAMTEVKVEDDTAHIGDVDDDADPLKKKKKNVGGVDTSVEVPSTSQITQDTVVTKKKKKRSKKLLVDDQ